MAQHEKVFGSVVLFDQCPVCGVTVTCDIVGSISDAAPDLTGKSVGEAMKTVSAVKCDVKVLALVVNHDCRQYLINPQ